MPSQSSVMTRSQMQKPSKMLLLPHTMQDPDKGYRSKSSDPVPESNPAANLASYSEHMAPADPWLRCRKNPRGMHCISPRYTMALGEPIAVKQLAR